MTNPFYDLISYVVVDTTQHQLSQFALERSQSLFPLKHSIVFSDLKEPWHTRKFVKIDKMQTMSDYNQVLLRNVWKYLETEYCLILHYDGFVINPDQFAKLFLHYDYIGATWNNFQLFNVGNGGFCLRSKKLMKIVDEHFPNVDLDTPEDVLIARHLRAVLEDKFKLRFAPQEIANHFSQEFVSQSWPTFGFHGSHLLPIAMKDSLPGLFEMMKPTLSAAKDMQMENACRSLGPQALESFNIYKQKLEKIE